MTTIVYKYRLWSPTTSRDVVEQTFEKSVQYYNALVDVENRRRAAYREARASLFPEVARLEDREREVVSEIEAARGLIRAHRSADRSGVAGDEDRKAVGALSKILREIRSELRARRGSISLVTLQKSLPRRDLRRLKLEDKVRDLRDQVAFDPDDADSPRVLAWYLTKIEKLDKARAAAVEKIAKLKNSLPVDVEKAESLTALSDTYDQAASREVKELRKTLYWGTYLLVEDAVKKAAKATPGYLRRKDDPPERLPGRIGIQIMGGLSPSEVATDTRMQLLPEGRNGVFRLRVGTAEGSRDPLWASFPLRMHRPLPADAKIKWAVVTRRPGHLTRPWIYHLCLTLQTSLARGEVSAAGKGTCAVNFGWRQVEVAGGDTLRVATLNRDSGVPSHVELPREIYQRFDKCKDLQSIVDEIFDAVKKTVGAWIAEKEADLPAAFLESFRDLARWRSSQRLADLVRYWRDHRLEGDDDVFARAWYWRGRWFHLWQWLTCNRQKALRARLDFYRKIAREVAATSRKVVVEDFDISRVAEGPEAEEEDSSWKKARENRTRASCHELRLCVVQACARLGTEVALVRAENNTRRCGSCGTLEPWDQAAEISHTCRSCGASWDQDVNNTVNSLARAARGEAATLVSPGKTGGNREISGPATRSYRSARGDLHESSKTQGI